jgi:hypothetical protein
MPFRPPRLRRIVGRAIKSHIDRDALAATMRHIEKDREILASLAGKLYREPFRLH